MAEAPRRPSFIVFTMAGNYLKKVTRSGKLVEKRGEKGVSSGQFAKWILADTNDKLPLESGEDPISSIRAKGLRRW